MIRKLLYLCTDNTDPYHNLALEQYLTDTVPADTCILYLWQNRHTVVIGRNQNAWQECRTALLEQDGGKLSRRLSGGGAVYHDMGNLNFTFSLPTAEYDLHRQQRVIVEACRSLGIEASFSGRNDILAAGRKFSGNSFYHHNGCSFHNGTLLVSVDMANLGKYLTPSQRKLQSKGVASVPSRVVNLSELHPGLRISQMQQAMAQAFADEIGGQGHLTKEDGLAAMQTAASAVCGDCTRCNLYYGSRRDDSYYLYYLLRTFEQKGKIDLEDMPRLFHEICSQREAYLRELNRSLGRATMNLGWKNRFLESRDAVIVQFRELAAILEEFSNQMEQASDVTASWEEMLSGILRRSHLRVDNMLVLQYENQQKEAFLTLRSVNGRCMTARDVAELLGRAIAGSHWSVAKDSKSLITRNAATFRFVEEGKYRMVYGMACSPREGEPISGDTCTVQTGLPGQVIMSLSDGMGSGRSASEDSEKVIELTQRLLETGFSARSALKLVNTVLLLAGTEQNPATIDLCCIDLGTGVLEAMKLGAVPTFILGREGVEFLEAGGLPMGIVQNAEPVLMSRKMWDGEKIIMISDGILEAMPGEHKEETFMEFISNLSGGNPQELAEQILAFASGLSDGGVVDDCTVLVGTVLERG